MFSISIDALVCHGGGNTCDDTLPDGEPARPDGIHYSQTAQRLLAPPIFRGSVARRSPRARTDAVEHRGARRRVDLPPAGGNDGAVLSGSHLRLMSHSYDEPVEPVDMVSRLPLPRHGVE